jgi:hypothetical protein
MVISSAPWQLAVLAAATVLLGALPLWWLLRRLGQSIIGRAQPAVSGWRYLVALVSAAALMGTGLAAGGLFALLRGFHAFNRKTHIAEVQCVELAPQQLRLYYVPIESDGARGATEIFDVTGDEWTVSGDVLRLRPLFTALGMQTVYRVTRVEGRWLEAAAANARAATAHDRGGGSSAVWLRLYRDGVRGPFGWVFAGAHGQAVSQLPDRRAVFDLYVTANGFIVDKRSL